jgi:putative membrane protein
MVSVLLQAAAVLATLATEWPVTRLLRLLLLVLPAAWLVERMGSTTGWPFGDYRYTARLVPQIGGVPAVIPVAWLMMLPPAWAVAGRILGDSAGQRSGWRFAVLSGLAFMAWDLFLDPQMVLWGYWVWTDPQPWLGGYFGIPWLNFGGWALSAALITALVTRFVRLDPLPERMLLAIYLVTWLLETVGQAAIWGLPGSALVGFVGMGVFVGMALWAGGG